MATFLPSPIGMPPELLKAASEGDYTSGKTPGAAIKAPRLEGGTYEGKVLRDSKGDIIRNKKTGKPVKISDGGYYPPKNAPKRLPPPKGAIPKGAPKLGSTGAMTALSLMGSAAPQGTVGSSFVPAPFASPKDVGKTPLPSLEEVNRTGLATPAVPKPKQSRTPTVPPALQQQVKADVEKGAVTGKEYVDASVQKANLEKMATDGRPLTQKETEAVQEKEGAFWNQLGIDGKTAALIGVGLAATAAGYGKGGFERGVTQGFDMMGQALGRRDARSVAAQQSQMAQDRLDLEREKVDLMRQRLEAAAAADAAGKEEKPESVATKLSRPQIETGVVDVMESLELTPSSFFGMGGGNLPDEETYKRLKTDFTDYIYRKRTEGDTRGTQELITERYQQLAGQ